MIPILLSIIATVIISLLFMGIISIKGNSHNNESFRQVIRKVEKTFESCSEFTDVTHVKEKLDEFNQENQNDNIKLILLSQSGKDTSYYPTNVAITNRNLQLIEMFMDSEATHFGVFDNKAFYSMKVGNYYLVVMCLEYNELGISHFQTESAIIKFIVVLLLIVISIIVITNYFLSKFILKSVVEPLEILNFGVQQIQLGNLDYRIMYHKKDEFAVVCNDFNNMSKKLKESVEEKKKDETSRKELIAGISHDLRTPLTSIKAYVDGLIDGIADSPQIQNNYLQTIKNKAEDMNQIVDKLFLFCKLDIGEYPVYPLKIDILEELDKFINEISEEYNNKGLVLRLRKSQVNENLFIDLDQLKQVVINILENSAKYKDIDSAEVEIECYKQDKNVYITFTDNGPGVPEEAIDKIYNLFYRNDPSRSNPAKGSGLGLAISSKIIERFEGTIWSENVLQGGLRTIIKIPIYEVEGKKIEANTNY